MERVFEVTVRIHSRWHNGPSTLVINQELVLRNSPGNIFCLPLGSGQFFIPTKKCSTAKRAFLPISPCHSHAHCLSFSEIKVSIINGISILTYKFKHWLAFEGKSVRHFDESVPEHLGKIYMGWMNEVPWINECADVIEPVREQVFMKVLHYGQVPRYSGSNNCPNICMFCTKLNTL